MARPRRPEARLDDTRQVLLVLSPGGDERGLDGFAGAVIREPAAGLLPDLAGKAVYLWGDPSRAAALDLSAAARVRVIREGCPGRADEAAPWPVVGLGRVPIDVHGLGVYYRGFFEPDVDYVGKIRGEHVFQALTESTKPGAAHRSGIYLTPVRAQADGLHFHLLRCSTNLSGPTDNFRATDRHIVDALDQESALVFTAAAPLNHVLAQIYPNTPADADKKQAKARISAHADKTKDMPDDGVMAFCTFYEHLERLAPMAGDRFDRGHRTVSGLTRLRFRRKPDADGAGPEQFTLTLYPGSVFFMSLATNRRYTHEIVPSELEASRLPTRLGYVVRCSKTAAVHADGRTFLLDGAARVPLEPPTPEGMQQLRRLYAEENATAARVDYGEGFRFSMNAGDYTAPLHAPADLFRVHAVSARDDLFAALSASARFEALGKGRSGAVLVLPDASGAVPVVRTTTAYTLPSRPFGDLHAALARQIHGCASLALPVFNNALLEIYTRAYATMGAHSDQALDLDEAGEIAVFSCYERPAAAPSRLLLVESKAAGGPSFVVPLLHGHAVVFSCSANRQFRHRIVLDPATADPDNTWLGLTLRASKTFVLLAGAGAEPGRAVFADGTPLTLASEEERREFYRLRRRENDEAEFVYPRITYTLSPGDLLPPQA
ncbi:MAG: hypothetical protein JNL82_36245 [Myxococcales bacterium]|nr:hypothetical protein [Myxococcales bacterium]